MIKDIFKRLIKVAEAPTGINESSFWKKLGYILGAGGIAAIPLGISVSFWFAVSPETGVERFLVIAASVAFMGSFQVILLIFWIIFVRSIIKHR